MGSHTLAKKIKLYSYLESWQNTYLYNDDNQMVEATKCEGNLTKKYIFTYDSNGNLTHECYRKYECERRNLHAGAQPE